MPSPIIKKFVKADKSMSFYGAIAEIMNGARVTRIEWGDKRTYCLLKDGLLSIHKNGESESTIHSWIVNDGDINGTDWIVINEGN